MFKKDLGISLYPEKSNKDELVDYVKKCYNKGFRKVFISFLQVTNKEEVEIYETTVKLLKDIGYYVVADIDDRISKSLGDNFLEKLNDMKIDCLRLDSPLKAKEYSDWTFNDYDFDVQVNASNNDHLIDNILDFEPRIEKIFACHNFYPQERTGLSDNFFIEASRKFTSKGIHVSAFVGSSYGVTGPQKHKVGPLVTLESDRFLPIRTQAKHLFSTNCVDSVIVGNYKMSDSEINELSSILNNKKIELDIELFYKPGDIEDKVLKFNNHFRRGDITEDYIRSTMTRPIYINNKIKPQNCDDSLNYGDVFIVNENNPNYNSELGIVLKDNYDYLKNKVNKIGRVKNYDLILLNYIKPWTRFNLRIIK